MNTDSSSSSSSPNQKSFFLAVNAGDKKKVISMLDTKVFKEKINVHEIDSTGDSAILSATEFGHFDIVELLISKVNNYNNYFFTFLMISAHALRLLPFHAPAYSSFYFSVLKQFIHLPFLLSHIQCTCLSFLTSSCHVPAPNIRRVVRIYMIER